MSAGDKHPAAETKNLSICEVFGAFTVAHADKDGEADEPLMPAKDGQADEPLMHAEDGQADMPLMHDL